ncbi:MAG: SDR family oxidoreductase [Gemmatimonadota bacterium]
MSQRPLHGLRGVVTGGSSGIGLAIAEALAEAGARLALVARGEEALGGVAERTGSVPLTADVSDSDAAAALPGRFSAALGEEAAEFVVHCAGAFSLAPFEEISADEFRRIVDTNLVGSFNVVRAFLPDMVAAGRGRIVLMGSVAGRRPYPGNAAYAASKYGLRGLAEVLRLETEGTGVACTIVEPAATNTPLWEGVGAAGLPDPAAMLSPQEVADAVVWLLQRPDEVRIPVLPIERS